jgi:hypothetical protein
MLTIKSNDTKVVQSPVVPSDEERVVRPGQNGDAPVHRPAPAVVPPQKRRRRQRPEFPNDENPELDVLVIKDRARGSANRNRGNYMSTLIIGDGAESFNTGTNESSVLSALKDHAADRSG